MKSKIDLCVEETRNEVREFIAPTILASENIMSLVSNEMQKITHEYRGKPDVVAAMNKLKHSLFNRDDPGDAA